MAKKIVTSRKKAKKKEIEMGTVEPSSPPAATAAVGVPKRLIWTGIGFVIALFWVMHKPSVPGSSSGSTAAAASSVPAWGKQLKLEVVSKFDHAERAMAIKADAEGNVYVLGDSHLYVYSSGKLSKTIDLKAGAPARDMAFDGKDFITNFGDNGIAKVEKSSGKVSSFAVSGASRLLGIGYSSKDREILVAEVSGRTIHVLDDSGKSEGKIKGPVADNVQDGFAFDLEADKEGNFILIDQYGGDVNFFGPNHKLRKKIKGMWSVAMYERAAIIKNLVYINCLKDERVTVMDMEGNPVGYIEEDQPQMITAGEDGFIYLQSGTKILKLKPLAALPAAPAAVPAAAKP